MAVYLGSNKVNLRGGQPMENGLPSGGLTGQVLAKSSNDDYVAAWTTFYDVPAGGSVGQVLAKSSDDDYAVAWTTVQSGIENFPINFTQQNSVWSTDKTYQQAVEAYEAGKNIYGIYASMIYPLMYYTNSANNHYITFQRAYTGSLGVDTPPRITSEKLILNGGSDGTQSSANRMMDMTFSVPPTGSSGQFLKKTGTGANNYAWASIYTVPSNGYTGQVLQKTYNTAAGYSWCDASWKVPEGGTTGQVLAKSSDDDYALTWTSIESDPALPSGGLNGQVLAKSSNDDYAVAWSTLPPGEFVITVTQTSTSGSGTFSMNRTIDQIKTAIESGQHVVVYFRFTAYSHFSEPGNYKRFPYKQTAYGYYEFENDFIDVNSDSTKLCSYLFKISTSSGAISLTRNSAYGVTGGNSKYVGKFLGATEGFAVPVYPEWKTIYQVPAGGSNGQFLKKTGNGLADYAWASVPSDLPSGGTAGQVLKKNSGTDYDVSWANESGGGLFVATFSDSGDNIVCDKNEAEVHDAAEAGTPIIGIYKGIILSCDCEEFIDNWSGYFRGYQYLANGTVRSIEIYLSGGCSLSTTYKPLKYDGHFHPSQNEFVLNTSARDYYDLYNFFDGNNFGECVACVTVDGIIREFSCTRRENKHDEDLDEWVFLARFTCSEVVENSGVYELHVFSFDSEQYHTNPLTIVVKNYTEKKVVLSAV